MWVLTDQATHESFGRARSEFRSRSPDIDLRIGTLSNLLSIEGAAMRDLTTQQDRSYRGIRDAVALGILSAAGGTDP